MNAMKKSDTKKDQALKCSLTHTSVNTPPKAAARADVHMQEQNQADNGGKCMGSNQHFCSQLTIEGRPHSPSW